MKVWWKIMLGVAFFCIGVGIVIGMIGFAIGRSHSVSSRNNTYSFSDTVEGVESIDLDVKFSKVEIVNGNEFSVEVKNMMKDGFQSYLEDGTWHLEDKYDDDSIVNLFGFEVPISEGWFNWDFELEDYSPYILVTIPNDFVANDYKINLGAGELDMEELNAASCNIRVGAGSMKIKQLDTSNNIILEVGVGELVLSNLKTQDAELNCGMGSIRVIGEVLKDLSADCGMGEIELDLSGKEKDYNFNVDCGMGEVRINSHHYDFIASKSLRNQDAIGTFDLNCGMGSIRVELQ